jgi:hypothetical protein
LKDGTPSVDTQEPTGEGTYSEAGEENSCVCCNSGSTQGCAAIEKRKKSFPQHLIRIFPGLLQVKPLRLLYFVLMQHNFKLREINQRLQRRIRKLKLRIKREPTNLDCLAQVAGINQQIYNRCEEEISRPIPQEEIVRVFIDNETQTDEVNMEEEVPPEK